MRIKHISIKNCAGFTDEELATEEWRPVVGYEGLYGVSSLGRIRRDAPLSDGRTHRIGKILKLTTGTAGYPQVTLHSREGKMRTWRTHWLVTAAFIGPRPDGFHSDHIDANKLNSRIANLEYVTSAENHARAARMKLYATGERHGSATHPECVPRGDNHPSRTQPEKRPRGDANGSRRHPERLRRGEANAASKCTADQVISIRADRAAGIRGYAALAKKHGVSSQMVKRIVLGQTWRHLL